MLDLTPTLKKMAITMIGAECPGLSKLALWIAIITSVGHWQSGTSKVILGIQTRLNKTPANTFLRARLCQILLVSFLLLYSMVHEAGF
jgi:hypothetical protein